MSKRKYVVRVVAFEDEFDTVSTAKVQRLGHTLGEFFECLRYAGVVQLHRCNTEGMCFDILPPAGTGDTEMWAKLNAERMKSFGYNAEPAPEWKR
jgi:hypothetical protein